LVKYDSTDPFPMSNHKRCATSLKVRNIAILADGINLDGAIVAEDSHNPR
jgi:hypothetical protein